MDRIYSTECDRCGKENPCKEDIFPPGWSWLTLQRHDKRGYAADFDTAALCVQCAKDVLRAVKAKVRIDA